MRRRCRININPSLFTIFVFGFGSEKFRSEGIVLEGSGGDEGGSDDDSEDSSEGEKQGDAKGTGSKEASTLGGDTEGSGSQDAAGVTPVADKPDGDGESGSVSAKECAVLLNGRVPHAGAVQPSATADSSAVPAGPAGDEGNSESATEGVGTEERKRDKGDSGGEEWSSAALKLEVEEAEAPGELCLPCKVEARGLRLFVLRAVWRLTMSSQH